jgi:hypothetical protein
MPEVVHTSHYIEERLNQKTCSCHTHHQPGSL